MSGSGGGFPPYRYAPQRTEDDIDSIRQRTADVEYERSVSESLAEILRAYNQRDAQLTNDRLNEVKALIEDFLESSIDLRFGGSISKHTYNDGMSDVDSLMLLTESIFASESPQQLLQEFESLLKGALSTDVEVESGPLAITLTYEDGLKLQLLPAIRTTTGVRIADGEGMGWSNVIHPERFAEQLTQANQQLEGRLVPTIKLVKGAVENLGLGSELKGYHVEAMAIRAFENYTGEPNTKSMLQHFFDRASNLIKAPIQDSTGQSIYIDDHLGPSNSPQREQISHQIERIAQKMREADGIRSVADWMDCIGE